MRPLTQARRKEKRTASLHALGKTVGASSEPTLLAFIFAPCLELFRWWRSGFTSACVNPKLLLIKVSFFKVVEVAACVDGFSNNYGTDTEIGDIPDRQGKSRGEKDGEGSKNKIGEFHCEKLWGICISNLKMWIDWTDNEMIYWSERTSLATYSMRWVVLYLWTFRFDRPAYHAMYLQTVNAQARASGCSVIQTPLGDQGDIVDKFS